MTRLRSLVIQSGRVALRRGLFLETQTDHS